mgnify:FL=1
MQMIRTVVQLFYPAAVVLCYFGQYIIEYRHNAGIKHTPAVLGTPYYMELK